MAEPAANGIDYKWTPLVRNYAAERDLPNLNDASEQHPLLEVAKAAPLVVSPVSLPSEPSKAPQASFVDPFGSEVIDDPLGASSAMDDPLSAALSAALSKPSDTGMSRSSSSALFHSSSSANLNSSQYFTSQYQDDGEDQKLLFAPRKAGILTKYTTTESITIPGFVAGVGRMPKDKVKERLEQLDQFEEDENDVVETVTMNQKDFIKIIEKFHKNLQTAWGSDQRRDALRIAIKLAKLLGDTTKVVRFYPSKWVLITEILDTFGDLVFERLKKRSMVVVDGIEIGLSDNFRASEVADHAKETCKNWFFKIASIRELLPRLYMELAIIRCYKFLYDDYYPKALPHIARIIRGIGDPLVSMYARAYLARRGHVVAPQLKDYTNMMVNDHVFLQNTFSSPAHMDAIAKRGLTSAEYLDLFTPALDWIVQCVAVRADETLFRSTLAKYTDRASGIVLNSIISSFDPKFISANAALFIERIKASDNAIFPHYELYRTLGVTLLLDANHKPTPKNAAKIFRDIWSDISPITDAAKYISVAEVFIEYPMKHINAKATNYLLEDIVKHLTFEKKYLDLQSHLQMILDKILLHTTNFTDLFGLESFVPLFDLFRGQVQIEAARALLTAFTKTSGNITDPIIINTLFGVAKIVHDAINAFSYEEEVRKTSLVLTNFITKMDFGRDFEKHLNFYVECRRAFANIDAVRGALVKGALNLLTKTYKIVKGQHSTETAAFARACIAYCYITIPSMEDIFARLHLYLFAGQVALKNHSVSQAESLFKAAVAAIDEVPATLEVRFDRRVRQTEPELIEFIKLFIASLVAVPGHPELGPFYLLRGLFQVVKDYPWEEGSAAKAEIYVSMIVLLSVSLTPPFPYAIAGVEGNDVLYAGTAEYEAEIREFINELIPLISAELQVFKRMQKVPGMKIKKAKLALDLLNHILTLTSLTPEIANLAISLHAMACKNKTYGVYNRNTLTWLRTKALSERNNLLAKLWQQLDTQQTQLMAAMLASKK
jgi:hypothetical protein